MLLKRSTCSSPNINTELNDNDRLMKCNDLPKDLLYHMVCTSRKIRSQKVEILDPRTKALDGRYGEDSNNVHEDLEIEDREPESERE